MLHGHHSYREPVADLALTLTGHQWLKEGQVEHTAVSQVVGPKGCKREKSVFMGPDTVDSSWGQTDTAPIQAMLAGGEDRPHHYLFSHWPFSSCWTPPRPHFPAQLLAQHWLCDIHCMDAIEWNCIVNSTGVMHRARASGWQQCPSVIKQRNRLISSSWLCL